MPTRFDPETTPDEFLACHRLLNALLPAHRLRSLLAVAGSPAAAFEIPFVQLTTNPTIALTVKQAERLREAAAESIPSAVIDQANSLRIWAVTFADQAYPRHLSPFADSPPLLFVRGDLRPEDGNAVAIVGSRRASRYGIEQAGRFAGAFAENGLVLVSGGAGGIDTAAHRGALSAGGRTLAVLGCGVDIAYPSDNRALFVDIAAQGALLSEFALGARPEPWRFPTRNRIIAGIGRATVLIETPRDSGAMITARDAAQYGREVWAVPGAIGAGDRSRGCHLLIQDGAGLADSPEDVLRSLGIAISGDAEAEVGLPRPPRAGRSSSRAAANPALDLEESAATASLEATPTPDHNDTEEARPVVTLSNSEARLLAALGLDARHVDEASQAAELTAAEAAVALTLLEMKGLIRRQPGNLYVRLR